MEVFEKCVGGKVYIFCTMATNFFYIGYFQELTETKVFVRKCHILAVEARPGGALNINFAKMPGDFLGDVLTSVALDRSSIAYVVTPRNDLLNGYTQMVSGIVTAGAGAIPPQGGLPGANQMFKKG